MFIFGFSKSRPTQIKNDLNHLLLWFLLLSSLLVLIKIPLINLSIHNFLFFLGGGLLIWINFNPKVLLANLKFLLSILAIIICAAVSCVFSEYRLTAFIHTIKYLNYGIIFIAFLLITNNSKNHLQYYKLIVYFLNVIGCLGIFEYFCPNSIVFQCLKDDSFYPRVSSILQNPNPFGVLMAIGAILTIVIYKKRYLSIFGILLSEVIFIVALSLSGSRNSWLVFLIGFGLLLYYRIVNYQFFGWILISILLSLLLFPVSKYRLGFDHLPIFNIIQNGIDLQLPSPSGTAWSRLLIWQKALSEVAHKPFTGLGIGVFAEHISIEVFGKSGFSTHNLLLGVLVDLGIPGLLIVITAIVELMQKTIHSYLLNIPIILFLISQLVDLFVHDFTFTTIEILFIAIALNSKSNKQVVTN